MLELALMSLVLSAIPIVTLGATDPKRRRTAGQMAGGMAPARRRLLVLIACLPGFVCILLGDTSAFILWMGGCALIGWTCAAYLRRRETAA